jgi:hypothetical protein
MDLRSRLKKLEQTISEASTTAQHEEGCICFPPGEPPAFHWVAEVETAAAVRCPLHGMRFDAIAKPVVYQANSCTWRASYIGGGTHAAPTAKNGKWQV